MTNQFQHVDYYDRNAIFDNLDEMIEAGRKARAVYAGQLIRAGWKKLTDFFFAANRKHAAYRELSALDDRLLADIGIQRGDIEAVVSGAVIEHAANNNERDRNAA